jgi:hypothetical protein
MLLKTLHIKLKMELRESHNKLYYDVKKNKKKTPNTLNNVVISNAFEWISDYVARCTHT